MSYESLAGLKPTHPGEILREDVLPALHRPKAEIARLLQVSRQTLYDILKEKQPITPSMALRIGKLTGTTPDGVAIKVRGCDHYEFRDGKVIRQDAYWKIVEERRPGVA